MGRWARPHLCHCCEAGFINCVKAPWGVEGFAVTSVKPGKQQSRHVSALLTVSDPALQVRPGRFHLFVLRSVPIEPFVVKGDGAITRTTRVTYPCL